MPSTASAIMTGHDFSDRIEVQRQSCHPRGTTLDCRGTTSILEGSLPRRQPNGESGQAVSTDSRRTTREMGLPSTTSNVSGAMPQNEWIGDFVPAWTMRAVARAASIARIDRFPRRLAQPAFFMATAHPIRDDTRAQIPKWEHTQW